MYVSRHLKAGEKAEPMFARERLPALGLWGALSLSAANAIAAAFGLGAAVEWLTGMSIAAVFTVPIAFVVLIVLLWAWLNSLANSRAGMLIYAINLVLAPFGYATAGVPFWIGCCLAVLPLPLYRFINWLSAFADDNRCRRSQN